MKKYILVFDSGMGGLTVLQHLTAVLPKEHFLYVADNAHMPYGQYSTQKVKQFVLQSLRCVLQKYKVKMIVFACNTATNCACTTVRETFGLPVVCIEPALKLAAPYARVLAFITETTYNQQKYKELRAKYPPFAECHDARLAEYIERWVLTKRRRYAEQIYKILRPFTSINPDAIVLGCTHYPLIASIFKTVFPNAMLLDGGKGTAMQVARVLEKCGMLEPTKGRVRFVCTQGIFYALRLRMLFNRIKKGYFA